MSWAAVMLFGSGLVFSTGLVWFFVQAWIFAIQARTIWLIVLLTITTTVAILSQGYLCAVFVSIPPDPKPRGVTQVNREVFASFPFDATASLVRRKGSDARPAIGWEIKTAQHAAASLEHPETTGAAACAAAIEDDRESQRRLPSPCPRSDTAGNRTTSALSPKSGEALHMLVSSERSNGGICAGERGALRTSQIASPRAGGETAVAETCVEDVVESGRAEPLLLEQAKPELLSPPKLSFEQAEIEIEEESGRERSVSYETYSPVVFGSTLPQHRHRRHPQRNTPPHRCHHHHHHHNNNNNNNNNNNSDQEMKLSCAWTASGQTDATTLLDCDDDDGGDDGGDDKEASFGEAGGGGQAPRASRLRFGSVGSGITDCCSDSADFGCNTCSGGQELLAREQQPNTAGEASPSDEQKALPTIFGKGGSGRLGDEPVVRVSELPDVCAICLGQYATGEDVHVLPCLHIFHAQCLDVWIVGHQSCPYCKADLNVLPQDSGPGPDISSASAYTCSLLSNLSLLVTWPLDLLRECRERLQHRRQQQQPEVDGEVEGSNAGIVDLASTSSAPAAASFAVPRIVDGGIAVP